MQEERRNCFVAITRTEETLTLTYADSVQGWSKRPSRFLREMGLIAAQAVERKYTQLLLFARAE